MTDRYGDAFMRTPARLTISAAGGILAVLAGWLSLPACSRPLPAAAAAPAISAGPPPRPVQAADPGGPHATTYRVRHALTVTNIPAGARRVRVWFWVPDDDEGQKLLDLTVTDAPRGWRLT